MIIPTLLICSISRAQTATGVDLRTVKNKSIATGAGPSDTATLRVISASDSPMGSVNVSSAAVYNVAGSTLAIHCTDIAGNIISCGSSSSGAVVVSTGSITSFQGGAWNVQTGTVTIIAPAGNTIAIPISATSLPLPTGAATEATLASLNPLTDTQLRASPVPVSGPLTDTQLRASPVSVAQQGSVTVTPGTGTFPVSGAFFQATQPVSIASANGALAVTSTSTVVTNAGIFPVQSAQNGSYTVTPGTGTFLVSGTFFQAVQPVNIASANGALAVTSTSTIVTNAGAFAVQASIPGGALAVTSTSTIVTNAGVFPVQASIPGGALAITSTSTVLSAGAAEIGNVKNSGTFAVQSAQNGSYTVTPGTGTFTVQIATGSVTAFQGGAPWSVNQSTVYVQNTPGGSLTVATHGVTQSGSWTVGVTTGSITSFQGGTWNVNAVSTSTVIQSVNGALAVTSTSTVVTNAGTFSVQASIPGGALAVTSTSTVVTNAGTFAVQAAIPGGSLGTTSTSTVISGQTGALATTSTSTVITAALPTGTNNIGTVSGSSVTAFQGGAPWSVNQSTVYVQNTPGGRLNVAVATGSVTSFEGGVWSNFMYVQDAAGTTAQVGYVTGQSSAPVNVLNEVRVNLVDLPTIAKGVQSSTGIAVQEIHDTGRQVIISSAAAVTGTTSGTIFTMSVSTNFTNGSSGTSFGVTSGKIFRIQNFNCTWSTTGATAVGGRCRLHIMSAGTCTATSPIVSLLGGTIPSGGLAAGSGLADHAVFFDGLEISGTQTFCASHIESTTSSTVDVVIMGYTY